MAANLEKEWTILIYANGNNDLEQEMHQAVDNIKKAAYIICIPEISAAIDRAGEKTGRKIDLLLLYIGYFNFIEVIYELGKNKTMLPKISLRMFIMDQ